MRLHIIDLDGWSTLRYVMWFRRVPEDSTCDICENFFCRVLLLTKGHQRLPKETKNRGSLLRTFLIFFFSDAFHEP